MRKTDEMEALKDRYPRDLTLADGTPIRMRPIVAGDKQELKSVMSRLSPESRYRRFLAPKSELSPQLLRYLTEIDYVDHFALGIWALDQDPPLCIGVARYIRYPNEPHVAEPAFTVVDDYQGRGLGTLMLEQLMTEARAHHYTHFRATVLDDNGSMKHLFKKYGAHLSLEGSGVDIAEFEVTDVGAPRDERGKAGARTGTAAATDSTRKS